MAKTHEHEHVHEHEHNHVHEHEHDHGHDSCSAEHAAKERELIAVLERELESEPTFSYHVLDIDCPHCAMGCQNAVRGLECVEDARLVYATSTLEVLMREGAEENHCRRHVLETVRSCGQDLELSEEEVITLEAQRTWFAEHREQVLMGVSGALLLLGLIAEHLLHMELLAHTSFTLSAIAGLLFIGPMAIASLKRKTADMNVLMSVAVIGGLLMGAYGEAAMVIFLDQVGEWLEGWSMRKTSGSIRELMNLTPPVVHVLNASGHTTDCAVSEVEEGQVIRILVGERVPLDGVILTGNSAFDEAPVTGESVPQDKGPGEEVFGGTLNTTGVVDVKVSADEDCSTIARIIQMVQGAQAEKAPYESFINRFAEVYTPIVMAVALVVGIVIPLVLGFVQGFGAIAWRSWIYRALSLLVVACPCALVISTPVSFVSAITRAANSGVLVKGGAYFDIGCKVDHLMLDKTGTLTQGRPQVVAAQAFFGANEDAILSCAAALEEASTHPLARAIVAHAKELGVQELKAEHIEELSGNGMRAVVAGSECALGKLDFARSQGDVPEEILDAAQALAEEGITTLVLVVDGLAVGVIGLADSIRSGVREAIERMHELGISQTEMLTGDNTHTAQAIARQAGLSKVSAELLPADKLDCVRERMEEGSCVCMVGDGINDAPALATANLGVTMGAAASDTALEVADVAILSDDLAKLADFFQLSRRTMNIVRENLAFAIGVKLLIMMLVIAGVAGMGVAVFGDTGVSLIVILNGMRLMRNSDLLW